MSRRPRPLRAVHRAFALSLLAATAAHATVPVPQDPKVRDTARELGYQGVEAYERGEWDRARQLFREAYELVPAPSLAIREADALVKLNRLVEAREAYARVAATRLDESSPKPFREAVTRAKSELATLDAIVPRLTVSLGPGSPRRARVLLDGAAMEVAHLGRPKLLEPGKHRVEVYLDGNTPVFHRDVVLAPGQHESVVVDLGSERTSSSQRTIGWLSVAAGGAGLAVGVTTGLLAAGHRDELEAECRNNVCPPSSQGDLEAYRSLRSASFVGYGVGLFGVGLGTALLLTAEDSAESTDDSARLYPVVGPGMAGLGGEF